MPRAHSLARTQALKGTVLLWADQLLCLHVGCIKLNHIHAFCYRLGLPLQQGQPDVEDNTFPHLGILDYPNSRKKSEEVLASRTLNAALLLPGDASQGKLK